MLSLNRAQIIGNLTRDPELRYTPSGQAVASFGVATNRVYIDANGEKKETVEFHNVVTWAKLAEICNQILSKGRKVYIEGRLQTRKWEGQDGIVRQRTEIIAENMLVLDRPKEWDSSGSHTSPDSTPAESSLPSEDIVQEAPPVETGNPTVAGSSEEVNPEEIPF